MAIELRYSLLSYIYSLIVKGAEEGLPMVRTMLMEFPNDQPTDETSLFLLDST